VSHHFNKSNIAIFTTKDSKDVVKLSISYYKYIGIRKICIVCPRDHHQELKFDFDNIEYIFDEEITYYDEIKESSKKFGSKRYWYLQQFLKLSLWNSSDKDLLIIDGDTIISKKTLDSIILDEILFYTKEDIARYNFFIKSAFNLTTSEKSFICNFCNFKNSNKFIFERNFLKFLDLVESYILNSNHTDLSEYQLHGTLEFSKNKKIKKLRIFRRADLFIFGSLKSVSDININNLQNFFKGYDAICYESNHERNIIKSFFAHIYKALRISW
jgi:hypothetical protein